MSYVALRMTGEQHKTLKEHLFPGDGKESVAVVLCGRGEGLGRQMLLVHKMCLIPAEICRRECDRITWPPTMAEPLFHEAAHKGFAIVKIHSHPIGANTFSPIDDLSDSLFFESVFGWVDSDRPHASLIMMQDGRLFGRAVYPPMKFAPLRSVLVAGDDVYFWPDTHTNSAGFAVRHVQLFGEGTMAALRALRIAVVGCSGTGSLVVEQLARLGVGELVLVDPDRVEEKNLNRIIGATNEDATSNAFKVDVLARNVKSMGLGTVVFTYPKLLQDVDAFRAVSTADVVIGCVDSLHGRHVLSRISRYYSQPYIDVGVKLEALEDGTINQVAGSVHYVKPDGLDLLDRGVFSAAALESEALMRSDFLDYRERLERGYVRGVPVEQPAVISVNMLYASLAVNELLARLHPFRMDPNAGFATTQLSLSHFQLLCEPDAQAAPRMLAAVGRGDTRPLLGMPALSESGCGADA